MAERDGDQLGEKGPARQKSGLSWLQVGQDAGGGQHALDRVVTQEGTENGGSRRQVGYSRASAAGTPCAVRPWNSVVGRSAERPTIIKVKKMPIDRTMAEFMIVAPIPEPWPRWAGGSEFMMAARLGEANRPMASPLT